MLEDMILAAINGAMKKLEDENKNSMGMLGGGLSL